MKTNFIYIFVCLFSLTLLPCCLVNSNDKPAYDYEDVGPFSKPRAPIVSAYLHIGTRRLDSRSLNLDGVDFVNLAFTVIKNNRMGLLHPSDADNFHIARKLKRKYPNIKVLVSIGGAGTSKDFSVLCSSKDRRALFVDDAVRFVRSYGMDGIDLDWEFPGMERATRDIDRVNFTALIQELRSALDEAGRNEGRRYYLTIASGAFDLYLSYTEPLKVSPLVDYFFIMTYDFYGQWNKNTGHHANLYPSNLKPYGHSVERIVNKYKSIGIPKEKLVIGAAFYGRQWNNVENVSNGLYRPGTGVGSITFKRINEILSSKSGFVRYWDKKACAPYLYNSNSEIFITYEDAQSVRAKVNYAYSQGLGGIMYWEYFSDCNGELSGTIVSQASILRGYINLMRLPGGFIIKKRVR